MVELSVDNWIAISGVVVGLTIALISLIISYLLNEKTLKLSAQLNEKTLRQSEEHVKRQLTYEDTKKAMKRLEVIFTSLKEHKDSWKLRTELLQFLSTVEGQFVPIKVRNILLNKISELDAVSVDDPSQPPLPSDEEIDAHLEQEEEMHSHMNDYELFEERYSQKMDEIISSAKGEIHKHLKKKINNK